MSDARSVLTRITARVTPQFVEDWLGRAGISFRKTGARFSDYNRLHLKAGEKIDEAPSLLWKAAQGVGSVHHAKAEADYGKAESDRMDAELKRRTMSAKVRQENANATKAEAEAEMARIRELQARVELLKQLHEAGVTATFDARMNLVVTPSPPPRQISLDAVLEVDERKELKELKGRTIPIVLPDPGDFFSKGRIVLVKWLVSVGARVEQDEPIFEVSSEVVDSEIPCPTSGVLLEIIVVAGSEVRPDQVLGLILPEEAVRRDSTVGGI